jgi:acyl-CoA thioesterase I
MQKQFFCLLCGLLIGFNLLASDSAQPPERVACVGDSITYGAGLSGRETNSYPAQLARLLGAGYDTRNFGLNGATMLKHSDLPYMFRSEYTNALDFAPDIVVIMLGTNDSKHRGDGSLDSSYAPENWRNKAEYMPDYEAMIAAFRRANSKVKVFVCLPPLCFPGRWGINDQTIHDEVIPLIRQVAGDDNATVIDLNMPLAGKSNLFPDTVHPNADGAKMMATVVYHALTGKEASASTP